MARLTFRKPTLVLLMGAAGTGKTTLANHILERVQLAYLDNNFLADAFHPDTRRGADYERVRPALYSALYRLAEENLAAGTSVLLSAPHVRQARTPGWVDVITSLLARSGARLCVLCCRCSEHVQRERLTQRDEPRDHWKLAHWSEYAEAEPVDFEVPFAHLSVLTGESVRDTVGDPGLHSYSPDLDSIVKHVATGQDGRTGHGPV